MWHTKVCSLTWLTECGPWAIISRELGLLAPLSTVAPVPSGELNTEEPCDIC